MNDPTYNQNDIELIEKYLDGTLTPEETEFTIIPKRGAEKGRKSLCLLNRRKETMRYKMITAKWMLILLRGDQLRLMRVRTIESSPMKMIVSVTLKGFRKSSFTIDRSILA